MRKHSSILHSVLAPTAEPFRVTDNHQGQGHSVGQGLGILQATHTIHHLQVTNPKAFTLLVGSQEIQAQSQGTFITLESFHPEGETQTLLWGWRMGVRWLLRLCPHNLRVLLPAPPPGKGAGLCGKGGGSVSNQVTEE